MTNSPDVSSNSSHPQWPSTSSCSTLGLAPFRALRYTAKAGDLARLIAPPYDVISVEEHRRLELSSPHNVVRLILPRNQSGSPEAKYQQAAETLRSWRDEQILAVDSQPALYIYEIAGPEHCTRGLVGTLELVPFKAGVVLPHEDTMPGPIADRLALLEETHANFEPLFLIYPDKSDVSDGIFRKIISDEIPVMESLGVNKNRHRIWAIRDPDDITAIADDLQSKKAVIADGHHRYTTYLRYQAAQHDAGNGNGPWDRILVFLASAENCGPILHAIHRVIPDFALSDAIELCGNKLRVTPITGGKTNALKLLEQARGSADTFIITNGSEWFLLTDLNSEFQNETLADWNITQQRIAARIADSVIIQALWKIENKDAVTYQHDADAAILGAQQTNGITLLIPPATVEQVMQLAEIGERMPRKSTLFTPKPLSGFLMRDYADEV